MFKKLVCQWVNSPC